MDLNFDFKKIKLESQFDSPKWIDEGNITSEEIEQLALSLEDTETSKALIKAKTFELIAQKGKIAVMADDIFQNHLMGNDIMIRQRRRWEQSVKELYLPEESDEMVRSWEEFGAYQGSRDFGHTSPNSRLLLSVGFAGLLARVELASKKDGLSDHQKDFYESCRIVLRSCMTVADRLAKAIRPYNKENADALESIASGAPRNTYEAMQLLILYYFLHQYVYGTGVRTLGRLDVLFYPFYKEDVTSGRYTKEEIREMLKFFLFKFWAAKVPFDLPFCLGGIDQDGCEVTNEISYLIVEVYNELNIHSPKIHIRVSERTPKDFIKLVLSCIRAGNSSFVFVNDSICIEALTRVGIEEKDANDYLPIGCYEPAVWGVEIGCTGNGGVNLAKAVELVFNNGRDYASGRLCGIETGEILSFDAFIEAIKKQIVYMTERVMSYVTEIERHYDKINPDPLLSCQYVHSVEHGVDVYEGGAKYNNSSVYFYSVASLVDSICAVKKTVFEDGIYTFSELSKILKSNWKGYERERAMMLRLKEKYGNNNPVADAITCEFSKFCSKLANNKPNGRGGVFKASLFTIDHCFYLGSRTMATPDGRRAKDPLSKNLSATVGMDKNGITALIHSVTKIDHASFPNGLVLDFILHPTTVAGDDGLDAFFSILMTYFKKGGLAMHGNVFDSRVLRDAQKNPEKYSTLQVRVCGWNAYFVNLSKTEQDCFIRQAEVAL